MRKLTSAADPAGPAFAANAAVNRALVEDLRARAGTAALGGPKASRDRHEKVCGSKTTVSGRVG